MSDDRARPSASGITRREALQVASAAALQVAAVGCGAAASAGRCALTPEQVEGPFFVETGLDRSDITEGREGARLEVRFSVVDASDCSPIEGATVELWHADATGAYSGFDRAQGNRADHGGETFLRGFQRSSAEGAVEFATIYPGWYPGRAPHVHIAVLLEDDRLITTQCYFEDALSARVYRTMPYATTANIVNFTRLDDDVVSRFGDAPGPGPLRLEVVQRGELYLASFELAVDRG